MRLPNSWHLALCDPFWAGYRISLGASANGRDAENFRVPPVFIILNACLVTEPGAIHVNPEAISTSIRMSHLLYGRMADTRCLEYMLEEVAREKHRRCAGEGVSRT